MDRVEHLLAVRVGGIDCLRSWPPSYSPPRWRGRSVQVAHAATHESRCEQLLSDQSPSDYIGFEAEGCRAR